MAISHVTKVLDDKDIKSNEFHHEITDLTVFGQSNKYVVPSSYLVLQITVNKQENKFAPNIICKVDILYVMNSSDCQLEVKLSNAMYPKSIIAPEKVVAAEVRFPVGSAAKRNKLTPADRSTATTYS
ncbi:hypothetical protein P5673_032300 [Acropora cervicornis]|uniref:Uncharacterized protein n=1 Tax=Acropora cervicornis TaxID=6130 RepID=A0AAD9PRI7_ACRCE|nr:hypothetical protein P5673_032300 [Acropora cervicornis]